MPFARSSQRTRPSRWTDAASFIAGAQITVPYGTGAALVPFDLWPAQRAVLAQMEAQRLLVLLKARQIGMTWLACAYVLAQCMARAGRTALLLSQGQLEANELIDRIRLMHATHAEPLPPLVTDNTTALEWANGSRIRSLPATRKAGRSFTASIVVLDEFAFMQWGKQLLAAVKPTIDNGGQLIILSSADGQGSAFHQFWQAASSGRNGYTPLFLDWQANPNRDGDWRDQRMAEGLSSADVLREYPANDIEAFTHATGLVYDVWADPGNVTEAADYIEGGGDVLWSVDDGYSGKLNSATGLYTAESHPRVFGLYQLRHDGTLCRFDESYAVKTLSEEHAARALVLPHDLGAYERPDEDMSWISWAYELRKRLDCYPEPDYAVVDSSAAELRGRLRDADIANFGGTHDVEEGIKELRRWLAPDANGRRRLLVHPRCVQFRAEMASYRRDAKGKLVKQFDHGPDEARMLTWKLRYE